MGLLKKSLLQLAIRALFCGLGIISTVSAEDHLQWGRKYSRNMVSSEKDLPESFDPAGYIAEVGLPHSLTAGRTNSDVLRAFHLINAYRPDARYFPFSKKTGALVQKIFLSTSRISISLVTAVDRLIDPLAVKLTEKKYQTDQYRSAPYGSIAEIIKGEQSDLPKEVRRHLLLSINFSPNNPSLIKSSL